MLNQFNHKSISDQIPQSIKNNGREIKARIDVFSEMLSVIQSIISHNPQKHPHLTRHKDKLPSLIKWVRAYSLKIETATIAGQFKVFLENPFYDPNHKGQSLFLTKYFVLPATHEIKTAINEIKTGNTLDESTRKHLYRIYNLGIDQSVLQLIRSRDIKLEPFSALNFDDDSDLYGGLEYENFSVTQDKIDNNNILDQFPNTFHDFQKFLIKRINSISRSYANDSIKDTDFNRELNKHSAIENFLLYLEDELIKENWNSKFRELVQIARERLNTRKFVIVKLNDRVGVPV